jgi:hypothetical protein
MENRFVCIFKVDNGIKVGNKTKQMRKSAAFDLIDQAVAQRLKN